MSLLETIYNLFKMQKIEKFFNSLEGAYAPNTIRSYKSDYMHYSNWCQKYQYDSLNIGDEQFASYLLSMSKELSVATIQRRLGSLSSVFNLSKNYNPTKESITTLTFKKIRRKFGKPQKQAAPLTYDILTKLKKSCANNIVGLRNRLLLQLGYKTMRRRSEICQFKFEDLQSFDSNRYALLLRHSKTDQYNQGKIIPISEYLSNMITEWSIIINQESGYILRSFKRNLSVRKSFNPASINQILKNLQRQANIDQIGELSGHSFRVGAALDLLDQGVPLEQIMLRGGWKSETTALRYLRNWDDQHWSLIDYKFNA